MQFQKMNNFPNLHAMRFFAAFAVILFHAEHKKSLYNLPTSWGNSYFFTSIGYGNPPEK